MRSARLDLLVDFCSLLKMRAATIARSSLVRSRWLARAISRRACLCAGGMVKLIAAVLGLGSVLIMGQL